MAPRPKRSRQASTSTGPSQDQTRTLLHDDTVVTRFNSMKNSKIFEGAFMKFVDFNGHGIREIAEANNFNSFIRYDANNVKIYPLLINFSLQT